ncbi:hypothetical protein HPB49_012560 [Dermacentor silvarum]|uniref:Uncharacterized protein n=1 Tax=Dermacentor silvarum TaxID=543639 RepID=A0ACB8DD22_DERSI|nr:hypothetical protein HPB49_012560 [Dermacentor silvarum]
MDKADATGQLSVAMLNVQSLNAHHLDVTGDNVLIRAHLLILCETWTARTVDIPGYRCVAHEKRGAQRAAGVAIYIQEMGHIALCTTRADLIFDNSMDPSARRPLRGPHHTGEPIELAQEPFPLEIEPQNLERMVSVLNVTKGFGSTRSLSNVSLDVYKGQITVLLGHNGAGKTTLMNVIAGMLLPDSGKVVIDGVDMTQFPERARQIVSFCQQESVFFPDLTVWEHLVFYATVVILDEPSSSLDPESRRELWDVLLAMRRRQTTVLLSTHDMHEADVLADRVVLLCRGSLCCAGSPVFLKKRFQ